LPSQRYIAQAAAQQPLLAFLGIATESNTTVSTSSTNVQSTNATD
jgi:hypothetical protein